MKRVMMSSTTKGIAIRLHADVYDRLEQVELPPRNELIEKAVVEYLDKDAMPVVSSEMSEEDLSDELYDEVYTHLYNAEMVPLLERMRHHQEIMMMLQARIASLEEDKDFLKGQVDRLSGFAADRVPFSVRLFSHEGRKKRVEHIDTVIEEDI